MLLAAVAAGCGPGPIDGPRQVELQARVTLLNKSHEMQVLRVRGLRPEVQLECDRVADDPAAFLPPEAFGAPVRWPLYSDQELGMGIDNQNMWGGGDDLRGRECNASLVESDTLPNIVVFWDDSLPIKSFVFDPDIPEHIKPDPQTVVLDADYEGVPPAQMHPYHFRPCEDEGVCGQAGEALAAEVPTGASYFWESNYEHPLHFEQPWRADERPVDPPPRCQMPGPGEALAWESPPSGQWKVDGLQEGIDGCHTLELSDAAVGDQRRSYVVCAPIAALADLVPADQTTISASFAFESGSSQGLHITADQRDGGVITTTTHIFLTRGAGLPSDLGIDLTTQPREGCAPVEAACGQADLPVDVLLEGSEATSLAPGESAAFDDGSREVYVARAFERAVADSVCEEDPAAQMLGNRPGSYIEAVSVLRY